MDLLGKISFGLVNGVIWGAVLALLSSGLNVVFGLMGTVNVAHGSLYMVGAYLAWYVVETLGNFWASLIIAPLVVGVLSIFIGLIVKRIDGKLLLAVLATFGFTLVLQGSSLVLWGGTPRSLPLPFQGSFSLFGTGYAYYRVLVGAIAVVVLLGLWLILERTKLGLKLRATREDPELSSSIGIPVNSLRLLGFGIGGVLAGFSGSLISPLVSLTPDMGMRVFATVFLIVILGGLGRIWRSVIVSLCFAVFRGIATVFLDPTRGLILTFALALLLILLRPSLSDGGVTDALES